MKNKIFNNGRNSQEHNNTKWERLKIKRNTEGKAHLVVLLVTLLLVSAFAFSMGIRNVSAASGYTEYIGNLSGGNNFAVRFPDQWNGMLAVVCRGSSATPVLDARTSFYNTTADYLLPEGYAVAASNYGPENSGESAHNTTFQLTQYLTNTYHISGKIFLVGASMGGSVALMLADDYRTTYSGVLDLNGPKDYKVHYAYKSLIAGMTLPEIRSYVLANCGADPNQVNNVALQWLKNYCNSSALNMVQQAGGTPQDAPQWYEDISPTYHADITFPVITVHGTGDMICPFSQSTLYQTAVASAGCSSLYRLYAVPPDPKGMVLGHVDNNAIAEIPSRFAELVSWSNTLDFTGPESAVPVTIFQSSGQVQSAGVYSVTNGGILQVRDAIYTGQMKLYITSSPPAIPDYTLTYTRELSGTVNMGQDIPYPGPWPDAMGIWHSKLVCSYVVNGQVLGTFEGEWKLTTVGWYTAPTPHNGSWGSEGHAVLQGSGIFKGQTLLLDYYGNLVFIGYLLTH